jgi:hypothetical protein
VRLHLGGVLDQSLLLCAVRRCGIDEETAARIAREIERGDTSNPHLAEERGQEVDDSGVSPTTQQQQQRQPRVLVASIWSP